METLTKAEIAAQVAIMTDLHQHRSRELVDSFFEEVRTQLASGVEIKLSSFGNFELKDKRARPGRNPKTGKEAIISARRVVTFKAGVKLKKSVA
jgi:integration host factor subunit alpha